MKWKPHSLFACYNLWYFIQRKCKRLVQHLSVNLEKACVTVFSMYHVPKIQVWMELKMSILYHMHQIKPILLFWFLARWEGRVDAEKYTCTDWCNWPFTLYITSYHIVSWGFIEACATCSPINTHDIQEHNVLFAAFCKFGLCTIYSVLMGHIPLTQKTLNT